MHNFQSDDAKTGRVSIIVRVSEMYERMCGYMLSTCSAICVTHAMRQYLRQWAGINAVTLYDKAPSHFHSLSLHAQHDLWLRLESAPSMLPTAQLYEWLNVQQSHNNTLFTITQSDGTIVKRSDRPATIISSTSWTADEDFSVLTNALVQYDEMSQSQHNTQLPKLLCIITGKGPLQQSYLNSISSLHFVNVRIITTFLPSADYPLILASVDLGISLHQSSSGLDLPMKVVDMYGCELPVCAVEFACVSELIDDRVTGLLFNNATQLAQHLMTLFHHYPHNTTQLDAMRQHIHSKHGAERWHDNWLNVVQPIIHASLHQYQLNRTRRLQQMVASISFIVVCVALLYYT